MKTKDSIFIQVKCKEENPPKWGWYNTDKGSLFWYEQSMAWSCNDERLSEEYPRYWYKEYSDQNTKPLIDEIATLEAKLKAAESVNEGLNKLRTSDNESWSKQCAEWMTKHEQIWNECLSANNKIAELKELLLNK